MTYEPPPPSLSRLAPGVIIHEGRLLVSTWPLYKIFAYASWTRYLLDLHSVAAEFPELSVEFLLHLGDSPSVMRLTSSCEALPHPTMGKVPVFGFDRWTSSIDIPTPHYYVQPDVFCHRKHPAGAPADPEYAEEHEKAFVAAQRPWCAAARRGPASSPVDGKRTLIFPPTPSSIRFSTGRQGPTGSSAGSPTSASPRGAI